MDYSKHPIYAADYVSALLIAIGLTIVFASAIRERNYRAWREVPAKIWLLAVGSWMTGVLVMWLGAFIARWLPLVFASASLFGIVFAVIRAMTVRRTAHQLEKDSPTGTNLVVAVYFCVTFLLLAGTIFARSVVAEISEVRTADVKRSSLEGTRLVSLAWKSRDADLAATQCRPHWIYIDVTIAKSAGHVS